MNSLGLNWYAAPAMVAVIACAIALYVTGGQRERTYPSRLYRLFLVGMLLHNGCEVVLFIFSNNSWPGTLTIGLIYYTISLFVIMSLAALALALATDFRNNPRFPIYLGALLLPTLAMLYPLWFTSWMITGYQVEGGVMPGVAWNSLHGPGYPVLIGTMFFYMLVSTIALIGGIRQKNSQRRIQCYVVLFSSTPLFLISTIVLLQLMRAVPLNPYINVTFATPLIIVLFLVGTGYAIYRHRLLDIEFYIPWSQARRKKTAFYRQIQTVSERLPSIFDLQEAMGYIAAALNCPVVVRSREETLMTPSEHSEVMATLPLNALSGFDSLATVDEVRDANPSVAEQLIGHRIFAAVPVPQGRGADAVVAWVFLGEALSESVYTSRDFFMVGMLFQRLETVFHNQIGDVRREVKEMGQKVQGLQVIVKEMTETGRAKDVFLGMISHELRTPLQTIISSIDLLAARRHDQRDAKVILRLENAARRLETQMKDLTDYAKLGAGKLEIRRSLFDLGRLIRECVEEHASMAKDKRIALAYDAPCTECPSHIWSDPERIRQILSNLLTNALKYTEQGSISVTCHCLDDNRMQLTVEDTGPGIPREQIHNVFQPFSQLDSSSARRHEGAGLGLAIINGLVELLGGSINVDSKVGRGTRLEVILPYEPGSLLPLATAQSRDDADKQRILVVDDHAEIRQSFSEMLETLGYSCDTSPDADDALSRLTRDKYDALLLDIYMPGKNGYDVIHNLRRQPGSNRSIPVIVITAGAEDVVESAMRQQVDEVLTKPVRIEALRTALARFMAERTKTTPDAAAR